MIGPLIRSVIPAKLVPACCKQGQASQEWRDVDFVGIPQALTPYTLSSISASAWLMISTPAFFLWASVLK